MEGRREGFHFSQQHPQHQQQCFRLNIALSLSHSRAAVPAWLHPLAGRICITRLHYHIYPSLNQINLVDSAVRIWKKGSITDSPTDRPTDRLRRGRRIGLDEGDGGGMDGRTREEEGRKIQFVLRGSENVNKLSRQTPDFN